MKINVLKVGGLSLKYFLLFKVQSNILKKEELLKLKYIILHHSHNGGVRPKFFDGMSLESYERVWHLKKNGI